MQGLEEIIHNNEKHYQYLKKNRKAIDEAKKFRDKSNSAKIKQSKHKD